MRQYAICNSLIGETVYTHSIKALKVFVEFCNKNQGYGPCYFPACGLIHYVPELDTYYISIFYDLNVEKFREELRQAVNA